MFSFLTDPLVLGIGGIVLAIVIVALIIVKRYHIADPDEAILVTGRKGRTSDDLSGQRVVTGGGVFVLPFVQKVFKLSLGSRNIAITTTAQTSNGITISARAIAVVKVGGREDMIRAAAQRFLSQQHEIQAFTEEVLSGSLRGIIGGLTVEAIIHDRVALAQQVLTAAEEALTKQGLIVDTLQIQEINDNQNYLVNLGRPEAARVSRAAQIADVEATRDAEEAKIQADARILEKNRELNIRRAQVQSETDAAQAEADATLPREAAIQRQRIVEAEEITAKKEAELREQKLNADVRKVADAEAYRIQTTAEGNARAEIATAEADKRRRELAAQAVELEGAAEASAISARGKAEAEAIEARGVALQKEAQAIIAQDMLKILPDIARELAAGYGHINNLTVVSADGATGAIAGEIVSGLTSITKAVEGATGIDLPGLVNTAVGGAVAGNSVAKGLKTEPTVTVPEGVPSFPKAPAQTPTVDYHKTLVNELKSRISNAVEAGDDALAARLQAELNSML